MSLKKVFLEYNHAHSFLHCLWLLCATGVVSTKAVRTWALGQSLLALNRKSANPWSGAWPSHLQNVLDAQKIHMTRHCCCTENPQSLAFKCLLSVYYEAVSVEGMWDTELSRILPLLARSMWSKKDIKHTENTKPEAKTNRGIGRTAVYNGN